MKIEKNKNYLIFTDKLGKEYKFDINTAQFISPTGKTLQRTPSGFPTTLELISNKSVLLRMLYLMHTNCNYSYTNFTEFVDILQICDKLDAIGFKASNIYFGWGYVSTFDNLQYVNKHFKDFAKIVKDNQNESFNNLVNKLTLNIILKEWNIENEEEQTIFLHMYKTKMFSPKELELILYWIRRGIHYAYAKDCYRIQHHLSEFFNLSKKIEYTPEKSDFFKQYIMVRRTYEVNKNAFDSNAIKAQMAKHSTAWAYEDNNYCIIVPQEVEDFKKEADQQHNCVYTHYLHKVVEGTTNVIFIRKRDNIDKSYITCEVDNKGYINQFLLARNQWVNNIEDIEYKRALQEFLLDNWNN